MRADSIPKLNRELAACRRCPRLTEWRERVARERRAAFRGQEYWGRPVPGFGDPGARVIVVGLAPAAHGANRTGRMFTGDRSGDFLYAALHATGFANRPDSRGRGDGLELRDVYITAAVRCAPPGNRPTPEELETCARFLDRELGLLERRRVLVALGGVAFDAVLRHVGRLSRPVRPKPKFRHGARVHFPDGRWLLGSYHPSQQNTFTGKLSQRQLRAVFQLSRRLAGLGPGAVSSGPA